jgi:hypothetical protein
MKLSSLFLVIVLLLPVVRAVPPNHFQATIFGILSKQVIDYPDGSEEVQYLAFRNGKTIVLHTEKDLDRYLDKAVEIAGADLSPYFPNHLQVSKIRFLREDEKKELRIPELNNVIGTERRTAIIRTRFSGVSDPSFPSEEATRASLSFLHDYLPKALRRKAVMKGQNNAAGGDLYETTIPFSNTGCSGSFSAWENAAIDGLGLRNLYEDFIVLLAANDCPFTASATVSIIDAPGRRYMTGNAATFSNSGGWAPHEMGHWAGGFHAKSSTCFGSVGTNCLIFSQGDVFTPLGIGGSRFYTATEQDTFGVLTAQNSQTVTLTPGQSQTVTVYDYAAYARGNKKTGEVVNNIIIPFAANNTIELNYEPQGLAIRTCLLRTSGKKECTIYDDTPATPNNSLDGLLQFNDPPAIHTDSGIRVKNVRLTYVKRSYPPIWGFEMEISRPPAS